MKSVFVWIILLVAGVSSWGIWKYQNTKPGKVNYLQVTTTSPPIGQGASPEQRMKFAKEFEKLFEKKGMDATVTTGGDQQRIVTITGKIVNGPVVHRMKDNVYAIQDLRELGFKTLIMTDGKATWSIDLKN